MTYSIHEISNERWLLYLAAFDKLGREGQFLLSQDILNLLRGIAILAPENLMTAVDAAATAALLAEPEPAPGGALLRVLRAVYEEAIGASLLTAATEPVR